MSWTLDELTSHLKVNLNDSYGSAIVIAALYKKLYGELPKLGLTGFQAMSAEQVCNVIPGPTTSELCLGCAATSVNIHKGDIPLCESCDDVP